jgi:calmodulin
MDSSFARKMGLGLTSVLEVDEEDFVKLVVAAFKRFDDDKSGALELSEILEAFHTLPLKCTEDQVRAKFKEFDVDNSGGLDMEEFETMMRQLREEQTTSRIMDVSEKEFDELCEVTFSRFDTDGSGGLELEEIVRAFQKLPLRETTEDEVRSRFTKHDVDRSGALDLDEFRDMMRELRKENAQKVWSSTGRPRLDAVERANVRNVVSMAEVKLAKLRAAERDEAMAHILAFVNEGRFEKESEKDKADESRFEYGAQGEYAGNPRSPLGRGNAGAAQLTPSGVELGMVGGVTTPAGTDTARGGWGSNPGPSIERGTPNEETSEYASYVAERLTQMPALRRNQVLQVVDLLADSFACGQSVPATRLLGVLSSFQAFPGGPGGVGGAAYRPGPGPGPGPASLSGSPPSSLRPHGATPTGLAPSSRAYSRSGSLSSNRSGYRSESPREERGPARPLGAPPRDAGNRGTTYY